MKTQSQVLPCLLSALCLVGCSELWGSSTRPDSQNCVRSPGVCSADQVCNADTEACEEKVPMDPVDPRSLLPAPPPSFILPGGIATPMLDFPRDANYVIATSASATLFYTLDGTAPQPGMGTTLSGQSPLSLKPLVAGTTVRWLSDYGPSYSLGSERSFSAQKTSSSPPDMGYIPEPAYFDLSAGSVVTVSPGQHVTGSVRFQAWQSTPTGFCPGCIIQYVISVEGLGPVGCMNTVSFYGPFPGQSDLATFAFDAPLTPGRYRMYSGLTLQFGCDGTMAGGPDIGEIFVQ